MSFIRNPAKKTLRKTIQSKLNTLPLAVQLQQSAVVTKKALVLDAYRNASRISIYLSMPGEINTIEILKKMFIQRKQVFVPTYAGDVMEMVQLNGMEDYESLPLTKWNIKQPHASDKRENSLEKGGLDLIFLPGVAFSIDGKRLGHGRGYYDKYLQRHFDVFPEKYSENMSLAEKVKNNKTILIGLALKEQIVENDNFPVESHDFRLDLILTS